MKKFLSAFCLGCFVFIAAFPVLAIDCKVVTSLDYCINEKFNRTLGESTPIISRTQSVAKKQYFIISLFITDYKTGMNKVANVNYDIQVLNPDGKVYFEKQDLKGFNTMIPRPNVILMAESYIKFCFEPGDKFGDYTVNIRLKDKVANVSKDFQSVIALVPFEYKKNQFEDDQSFSKWMNYYYTSPSPEKAIDAYFYFLHSKLSENSASFPPVFSFFLEIFSNNKFLFPYLLEQYESQDERTKTNILRLLRHSNYELGDFANKLSKNENETYQKLLSEKLPNPYGEITDAAQLDMLWGMFLANGSYKPVKKIVDTLALVQYKGSIDKYQSSNKTEDDQRKAMYDAIFQSVEWSLKSNCSQHRLVKDYCNFIYEYEKLPNEVRVRLKEILGK